MSTTSFGLAGLPTELSEQILLHLPGQDIIKMEAVRPALLCDDMALTLHTMTQVNRYFADLIRGSPILQYHRELFSAGLIDNPHHPCNLAERRKLCKEYVVKWTGKVEVVKRIYQVPGEPSLPPNQAVALGGDLLALSRLRRDEHPQFLRVPPGASQRPIEGWKIPQFPFDPCEFAAYPPADLLVVAELREKWVTHVLIEGFNG